MDFLPVKCDACSEVFCLRHYQYETHNCDKAKSRDVQVPACPLCSEPVISRNRNELPDVAVSQHIDQYCKRNDQIKNRIPNKPKTNLQACTYKSCKQKDLIYLECKDCRLKFCIKHRHPSDHLCVGPRMAANLVDNWQSFRGSCSTSASTGYEMIKNKAQQISKSGLAALDRLASTSTRSSSGQTQSSIPHQSRSNQAAPFVSSIQGSLSEQEALAIALNESKMVANGGVASTPFRQQQQQEDEDLALARALHESQMEASTTNRGRGTNNNSKDNCVLS